MSERTHNYEHSFNVQLAKEYGVDEAIMLKNIYFWVIKNEANGKGFHKGKYWTYNSAKAYEELFPYWTEHQIRRILKSLLDNGLIEKDVFNKVAYDRTSWYTLTTKAFSYFTNSISLNNKMELGEQQNGTNETTKPIPDINKDVKQDVNKNNIKTIQKDLFNSFWQAYPKKVSKGRAEKTFNKQVKDQDTLDLILEDLERRKDFKQWQTENGQYIPYPSTYLNNKGWLDEYEVKTVVGYDYSQDQF